MKRYRVALAFPVTTLPTHVALAASEAENPSSVLWSWQPRGESRAFGPAPEVPSGPLPAKINQVGLGS